MLTFNEILEKGFDGHNFISGLNSHLRDLLICKDESTIKLLEATPAVKQHYLKQTSQCPVDFLFRSLEIGTNCDLTYKASKNPRLHIELSLIRLCRLLTDAVVDTEKKKPDLSKLKKEESELTLPSRSQIVRQEESSPANKETSGAGVSGKHDPVIEKSAKTFSIKELINDEIAAEAKRNEKVDVPAVPSGSEMPKADFTPEALENAWTDFTEQMKGEGPRIISMFKSIKPELENNQTIRIHLSNATQKDTFVHKYKQRLINYMEKRFIIQDIDIETIVDLSETNEIIYSDEQKYSYLNTKYPIMKDIKKTFNLDIN